MVFAGCDVGSLTANAVLMKDDEIISSSTIGVRPTPEQSAKDVMNELFSGTDLSFSDIDYCVSTGYGREKIPFADDNISEISCHGKGAFWLIPSVITTVDIGGQDCKVIKIDENGDLKDFIMNDKCAAGTGRFLELMAETLKVSLEDLGPLSFQADEPIPITNRCSVYAESEVATYVAQGADKKEIAAGVNEAMARRLMVLIRRLGLEEDFAISGGVAKNEGVVKRLEKMLGVTAKRFKVDPQIVGALGAALFSREKFNRGEN